MIISIIQFKNKAVSTVIVFFFAIPNFFLCGIFDLKTARSKNGNHQKYFVVCRGVGFCITGFVFSSTSKDLSGHSRYKTTTLCFCLSLTTVHLGVDFLGWGFDARNLRRDSFYSLKVPVVQYTYGNNPTGKPQLYKYPIDIITRMYPDQGYLNTFFCKNNKKLNQIFLFVCKQWKSER